MRTVVLTAEECSDKEALHRHIAEALDFPSWYGGNLDALHDCLTDMREDVAVRIPSVDALEEVLGPYTRRLMRVLVDASSENPHIHLSAE